MLLPLSIGSRSWVLAAVVGMMVIGSPRASAQQPAPTGQLPEEIRRAKIYQLPTKGGQPAASPAVYKSLSFEDINLERLLLGLAISIRPVDRPATIQRIYFQDVRVSGVPVHIETFEKEFKLSNKNSVDLPAPLMCSIVFADLDSLKPVQDMVDKDQIQITGQSFIEVKLNSLEKIAVRAKQMVIPATMNEQVPLNLFQGNPLLRMTAHTILATLSNPTSEAAVNMAKEHLAKLHQDQTLGAVAKPAVYLLYTEYTVLDPKSKASEKFSQSGTGFLVSGDGKLLTTKRVIAPWKFDPQVAVLLQRHHLEVDQASVKIYAWPAGAKVIGADGQPDFPSALSTQKQTLKVLQTPPDQMAPQQYQDPDSGETATLLLHAEGESDLALLQLRGTGFHPLAFLDAAPDFASNPLLVMCSFPFGTSQPQTDPRLLGVRVKMQGAILAIDHQVDPGESGAPLLSADGKVVALAASAKQCISGQIARKMIP
jgi:S1-C subfamily serine protease